VVHQNHEEKKNTAAFFEAAVVIAIGGMGASTPIKKSIESFNSLYYFRGISGRI
jgi:hypothetical protein